MSCMGHSSIWNRAPLDPNLWRYVRKWLYCEFCLSNYRGCLLVTLVAIVSWLECARGVPSCRILDRQLGLSAKQYQICLKEGSQILQNTVLKAKKEDFPTECQYWMSDSRWNCSNISMPVFPKSFQSPKHWVHKREYTMILFAFCPCKANMVHMYIASSIYG